MSMVSIVMTTYNGEKYIAEQIDSILASSFQDIEINIFDDGSRDGTVSILREYEKRYLNKIHVYQNKENLGVTKNFLQAVGRTRSDYIMFCDQDDYWKPDKIAVTLKRMRHMEAQVGKDVPIAVFTDAKVVDEELNTIDQSFFKSGRLDPTKTDLPHLLMENKLIGCTIMFNSALRKIIEEYEIPENAKFHDWWVGLIAASLGKIGYVNQSTLLYRQHGNNVVGNSSFLTYIKDRVMSLQQQKKSLRILQLQAEEFLSIYGNLLEEDKRSIIRRFADLGKVNFIKRRIYMLRYGYLKSGIIRNIGLMLLA
ncbi:MAG: glycosyltransferase family 2 protein [Clostridiales bacterium]|nr:glycosyltransferase family 2 protein [Clostridiales bacterium]